ncbi:hypothetical protein HZA87_03930 [Candidatus Uhrbacteria bacterium]|nr:hypothetical protein [Candidatus Uhrbacteria bacterium]
MTMKRICDQRAETGNEYLLRWVALLSGFVALICAGGFVIEFFEALQWNVNAPEAFRSTSAMQWTAVVMLISAIIMGDALMWKAALGRVDVIQKVILPAEDFGKGAFLLSIGCILVASAGFVVAIWWAPLLFVSLAIGFIVAAGACCFEWRQCAAYKKSKNEAAPT